MQTKINGEKEDLSAMLIGAERYALSYGDECDKVCWMQLLEKLRKENITNEKAKSRKSRKEKQR